MLTFIISYICSHRVLKENLKVTHGKLDERFFMDDKGLRELGYTDDYK